MVTNLKIKQISKSTQQKYVLKHNNVINHKKNLSLKLIASTKTVPYFQCCDNPSIIEFKGQLVCKNCAIVHESALKDNLINEFFNNAIHMEINKIFPENNLGNRTIFYLENIQPQKRMLFYRLAKLNKYYNSSIEANLIIARNFLNKLISQLDLPKMIYNQTLFLYNKVIKVQLTKGRSIKALLVACLYIICRLNNISFQVKEFALKSNLNIKTLRRAYRLIQETFNIRFKSLSSSYYLSNFSIQLGLSPSFREKAQKLLDELKRKGIQLYVNSKAFAVAIIYYLSKKMNSLNKITQRDLASISKISEVTIRKYIKLIQNTVKSPN